MVLNIRNEEADALARRLAEIDRSSLTDAVVTALREALAARRRRESAVEAAQRLLKKRGVKLTEGARRPVPQEVWDELHEEPGRMR